MENKIWLDKYNQLNNSFKQKFVFRIGTDAGFFSEFNNMVFAMLYCLQNQIKFILSSKQNKFSINKGWRDFFLPFTKETNASFHIIHNNRGYYYNPSRKDYYKLRIFKKFYGIDFMTQDLWLKFRAPEFWNSKFSIPELGITNSSILEGAQIIIENIWRYQSEILEAIELKKNAIKLPNEYIGVHIRGGDKITEHKLFSVNDYVDTLKSLSDCKNIYVATDDYNNVIAIKNYTNYNIYTLCKPKSNGHVQSDFDSLDKNTKREALVDLFADVDILSDSALFIGTYSSNIGMFLGMKKSESFCYCLDFDSWQIW